MSIVPRIILKRPDATASPTQFQLFQVLRRYNGRLCGRWIFRREGMIAVT
jgi:hypothetical protein